MKKLIGRRIRQLRTDRNWSQDAFALSCGLNRSYLGGIERGENGAGVNNLEKIAKGFDMTLSQLFDFEESELRDDKDDCSF